jgi:hypothetical protein
MPRLPRYWRRKFEEDDATVHAQALERVYTLAGEVVVLDAEGEY